MRILRTITRRPKATAVLALAVLLCVILATPVLAITYTMSVTVTNSSATDYGLIPIILSQGNTYLSGNGFMSSTGLDVLVWNGSEDLPTLIADTYTLFTADIGDYTGNGFTYTCGNAAASSMPVIVGYGGYVTTADAAALEPGSNFSFYWAGGLNMAAVANKDIVYKQEAFRIYVTNDGKVRGAILAGGDAETVSVTGTSTSDIIAVRVTADGTNLKIYINDSVTAADSAALGGASVPNNANSWILFRNNSAPYTTDYTETVGGTAVLKYQPVTIVNTSTLPDRQTGDGAQDGTITWGANPAGVTATVGILGAAGDSSGDAEQYDDIAPPIDNSSDKYANSSTVPSELQDSPFRPIVVFVSNNTGIPEMVMWIQFGTFFVVLGVAAALMVFQSHMLASGIVGVTLTGFMIALGIYPWWSILAAVTYLIVSILTERTPVV